MFSRGEEYYRWGRVTDFIVWRGRLSAFVLGTQVYRVEVWNQRSAPAGFCECPAAGRGGLCKHQVAVGLAGLDDVQSGPAQKMLIEYLRANYPETAIDDLLNSKLNDRQARRRLLLQAVKWAGGEPDFGRLAREIEHAAGSLLAGEDDQQRRDWIGEIEGLLAALAETGFEETAGKLAEYAAGLDNIAMESDRPLPLESMPEGSIVSVEKVDEDRVSEWTDEMWLSFAARQASRHPEDSLDIYKRLIEKSLRQRNLYAVLGVMKMLRRVRRLYRILGREDRFDIYLAHLRMRHSSHRIFKRLVPSIESPGEPNHKERKTK